MNSQQVRQRQVICVFNMAPDVDLDSFWKRGHVLAVLNIDFRELKYFNSTRPPFIFLEVNLNVFGVYVFLPGNHELYLACLVVAWFSRYQQVVHGCQKMARVDETYAALCGLKFRSNWHVFMSPIFFKAGRRTKGTYRDSTDVGLGWHVCII